MKGYEITCEHDGWKHTIVFDRPYSADEQAECMAIVQAEAEGHCDRCEFFKKCFGDDDSFDASFNVPAFAWCMIRKAEILAVWKSGSAERKQKEVILDGAE